MLLDLCLPSYTLIRNGILVVISAALCVFAVFYCYLESIGRNLDDCPIKQQPYIIFSSTPANIGCFLIICDGLVHAMGVWAVAKIELVNVTIGLHSCC
jgi:hypothetical protein